MINYPDDDLIFESFYNDLYARTSLGQTYNESYHIHSLVRLTRNVLGDIAEVGVYAGGSASIIKRYMDSDKTLYLIDTFEGIKDCGELDSVDMPTVYHIKNGEFKYDEHDKTIQALRAPNVTVIKGYFPQCVDKTFANNKFSFVHLDVDTYLSTFNCFEYFYPLMSTGGIILTHDYRNKYTIGVNKAVNEFFADKKEYIIPIGDTQAFMIKL